MIYQVKRKIIPESPKVLLSNNETKEFNNKSIPIFNIESNRDLQYKEILQSENEFNANQVLACDILLLNKVKKKLNGKKILEAKDFYDFGSNGNIYNYKDFLDNIFDKLAKEDSK